MPENQDQVAIGQRQVPEGQEEQQARAQHRHGAQRVQARMPGAELAPRARPGGTDQEQQQEQRGVAERQRLGGAEIP